MIQNCQKESIEADLFRLKIYEIIVIADKTILKNLENNFETLRNFSIDSGSGGFDEIRIKLLESCQFSAKSTNSAAWI